MGIFLYIYIFLSVDTFLLQLKEELGRRGNPWIAGETEVAKDTVFRRMLIEKGHTGVREDIEQEMVLGESKLAKEKEILGTPLPTSLDWRDYLGENYITPVREKSQGQCGCCWAFATVATFEAKLNIFYKTPGKNRDLAEQFVVSCDPYDRGCCGGLAINASRFLTEVGVPDEECFPFQDGYTYACSKKTNYPCASYRCSDWKQRVKKIIGYGEIEFAQFEKLKYELLNGPVMGSFATVKEDFLYYKGGVYTPIMGRQIKHAVSIIGWNSDGSWLIKNSYGPDWGENGYGSTVEPPVRVTWICVGSELYLSGLKFLTNDEVWDKGEELGIVIEIGAIGRDFTNVKATLSSEDREVEIISSEYNFGEIKKNEEKTNSNSPFKVKEKGGRVPRAIRFKLILTANNGYLKELEVKKEVGQEGGRLLECFIAPDRYIYGIAREGNYLWMTDFKSKKIYKVEEEGFRVVKSISFPEDSLTGITYDNDRKVLWVHNLETKKIYKIDPTTGNILENFPSPANNYPTGLAYDGEVLYAVDMKHYKIYKVDPENGNKVDEFSIPISPKVENGPRGLTFEKQGPDGGSLLLVMTYWTGTQIDSTLLWEITRDGRVVEGHHFKLPPKGGRAVEVSSSGRSYWVNHLYPEQVCKVLGFYPEVGVEEEVREEKVKFRITNNPTCFPVRVKIESKKRGIPVKIYRIDGRLVNEIYLGEKGEVFWWGYDKKGELVGSGVYFLKISLEKQVISQKIIVLH